MNFYFYQLIFTIFFFSCMHLLKIKFSNFESIYFHIDYFLILSVTVEGNDIQHVVTDFMILVSSETYS